MFECLSVCLSVRPFACPYALSQVAEATPLALRRFGFTTSFSADAILSLASGMPDLVLAILFALQNDISAAIDVGLAAALTVTMCVDLILVFVDIPAHCSASRFICDEAVAVVAVFVC